ncbi:uncharacterized protein TNCV_551151 [Trichonephila clavipes]|nr:uncharacterized protein TNCV_551151 [Trichonephila clavipes]
MGFNKGYDHPYQKRIANIEYSCSQLSCELPKWKAKRRHAISFVLALLKTLEEELNQQPINQDSPKDVISELSLEIELIIPFAPNQTPQDITAR